jgi:hypothetical protein
MHSINTRCRVYDPEAVNTMGWAVNQAFEGLSEESKRKPYIHRDLALCILRLYDEGEHKRLRLSKMALANITIVAASARKHVSNEGIARKLSVARISSGKPALTL